jgi:hypothetical protein
MLLSPLGTCGLLVSSTAIDDSEKGVAIPHIPSFSEKKSFCADKGIKTGLPESLL